MLQRCWAPCFTLNSGYLGLEQGSRLIAIYSGVVHIIFLFYGIYLLLGGQSDSFFSPFFEFNRKDSNILAFFFIAYCIFYLFICSIGLLYAIKMETRFFYLPWLYLTLIEILFLFTFGSFLLYRYYHNEWSLFAFIVIWSTAFYHSYLYSVVLSLYYYVKKSQEPNFIEIYS
ncbi:hypothetical protein SSS_01114 [Sarcoptes scabiei]|uniref:Uncharacterized protein n=1 Tax=Sarcoptes scabiei TaxID=52283 RepID=A0A834RB73_SARSC|nr:hypothetical protein SSS_01114 [Sarcoptes scabiei]UXI19106.1 vacuolar protein sorting-associated protein 52 [Sarcoptes scabiei]